MEPTVRVPSRSERDLRLEVVRVKAEEGGRRGRGKVSFDSSFLRASRELKFALELTGYLNASNG